ncbi:MAG: hypothetical protein WBE38_05390 [Terracidiphilus sp.]
MAVLWLSACFAAGQSTYDNGKLPDDLKPSLETRLALYTQAQRDGQWDVVASMLGGYRGGGRSDPITSAHRNCLIEQMKAMPMITFKYEDAEFSTEILNVPPERRWWLVRGDATLKINGEEKVIKLMFPAYRDHGQWYFSPPNMDEYWEKTRLTEADFAADYANEIIIHNNPDCPLEITDLHASLDRTYPSLRNLMFKLKNRSRKKVVAYTLRLYVRGGDTIYGTHGEIDPGGSRDEKMQSSRYVYFCDGVTNDNLIVDDATFADGTDWHRPRQH